MPSDPKPDVIVHISCWDKRERYQPGSQVFDEIAEPLLHDGLTVKPDGFERYPGQLGRGGGPDPFTVFIIVSIINASLSSAAIIAGALKSMGSSAGKLLSRYRTGRQPTQPEQSDPHGGPDLQRLHWWPVFALDGQAEDDDPDFRHGRYLYVRGLPTDPDEHSRALRILADVSRKMPEIPPSDWPFTPWVLMWESDQGRWSLRLILR